MKNVSITGQGLAGHKGGMACASYYLFLLLATVMLSEVNADRVIESKKSTAMKATAWVFALVSTLLSLFAMVFVIVYRKNKIVTVGQPFFLCIICLGSFLVSFSIYFDAGAIEEIPNMKWAQLDKMCLAQLWCLYFGILLVLGALFCKLWRAEKACQFRKGRKILVQHVLWPFGLIIMAEIILLIVASVVYPPEWGEVLMDPFDAEIMNNTTMLDLDMTSVDNEMKMPKCYSSPLPTVTALQATSHILIISSQVLVIWMAYQTRNIPEEIVDTKRVYYLMLYQFIMYIPYLLLAYGVIPCRTAYHYVSLTFAFLFSVTSVGFLVFPKVYYVFYFKRHGKLPDSVKSIVIAPQKIHVSGITSGRSARTTLATSTRFSNDAMDFTDVNDSTRSPRGSSHKTNQIT